ncbi:MAG: MarR family transcriptional regulator [Burkholderiales bacterium]|nr:MarR family transcriptional regulator [Burkholderiales bacterium]
MTLGGAPAAARLDRESRVAQGDHEALRLWLRLLACTTLIETSVRSALRRDFDCTLPRLDLMSKLERHPEGLRMGELSRRMMVTGGNVTGITDQLVKEGLVTREAPPDDRRACVVKLTPTGRKALLRMAEAQAAWVARLFAGLSAAECRQLHALLAKLKASATASARSEAA